MLAIDLTDLLDGFTARKCGCPTAGGAILDASVDFIVLLALYIFYSICGVYPLFLIILMVFSFGFFTLTSIIKKAIVKSRFGKYTGAVLYFAVTLSSAAQAFFPYIAAAVHTIAIVLSAIILAVSIFENLMHAYRQQA
jgi:phosphatidylglycerophosphate synthase